MIFSIFDSKKGFMVSGYRCKKDEIILKVPLIYQIYI